MIAQPSKVSVETEECFRDFTEKHASQIPVLELLADFCLPEVKNRLQSVLGWHKGTIAFPGGEALLRLRCFLTLAGYQVAEMTSRVKPARDLGMMIGFGVVKPQEAADALKYQSLKPLDGIWRITVLKSGYSATTGEKLTEFLTPTRRRKLAAAQKLWQARVNEVLGLQEEVKQPAEELSQTAMDNLRIQLAAGLGSTVTTATSLVNLLLANGGAQAAYEATADGQDVIELIAALKKLLAARRK